MEHMFYQMESTLGFLCMSANRLIGGHFRRRLTEAGIELTPEQWGVLACLWNRGGMSQEELAAFTCVDKSSMSRVLDVLERRRLVRRERDPSNARRKILYANPEADALKGPSRQIAEAATAEILQAVTEADLQVCLRVLKQVKETIQELSQS